MFHPEWLQLETLQITKNTCLEHSNSLRKYTSRAGNAVLSLLALTHFEPSLFYSSSTSRKAVYLPTTSYLTNVNNFHTNVLSVHVLETELISIFSKSHFVYLWNKSKTYVVESHVMRNNVCKTELMAALDPG